MSTSISVPHSKSNIRVPLGVGRQPKARSADGVSGVGPTLVRIAVDLTLPQNHANSGMIEPYLQSIQAHLNLDCVFVALFNSTRNRIGWVAAAKSHYAYCNPRELVGSPQPCDAEMLNRLGRYQLADIRDSTIATGEYPDFCSRLVNLNLCSMLVGGILIGDEVCGLMVFGSLHRRDKWEAEAHLALKLMSSSYAAGYERNQLRLRDRS